MDKKVPTAGLDPKEKERRTKLRRKMKTKGEILFEVEKLKNRGYAPHQIAERLNVGITVVHRDLAEINHRYAERTVLTRAHYVEQKLRQYEDIRQQCWDAYDRSMEDSKRVTNEYGVRPPKKDGAGVSEPPTVNIGLPLPEGPAVSDRAVDPPAKSAEGTLIRLRRIVVSEGRLPSSTYMNMILATLKAERELLGLDDVPVSKVDVRGGLNNTNTTVNHNLDWDVFAIIKAQQEQLTLGEQADPVEQLIAQAALPKITQQEPTDGTTT